MLLDCNGVSGNARGASSPTTFFGATWTIAGWGFGLIATGIPYDKPGKNFVSVF